MRQVSKQRKLQKKKHITEKSNKQKNKKITKKNDTIKITRFIEKYAFGIMLFLFSVILFFIYGDFITLKKVFLYKDIASDTINVFFPNWYSGLAVQAAELSYNFTSGMGEAVGAAPSFIDKLLAFLFNPLGFWTWFVNVDNVHYMFVIKQLANILYAAVLFFFYSRLVNVGKYASILGSLLISFSGFMIVGSIWAHHTGHLVGLLMVLVAFELLLMRKIWFIFPIVIAYVGSIGFFYYNAVFLTIYVLFRYFDENEFTVKDFSKYVGVVGTLTLLGLLVRIPSMYNEVISILNKPRVSGDISKISQMQEISVWATGGFMHNITAVLRFFGNDLLGTGRINEQIIQGKTYLISDFKGYGNYYEAPMFYIGLISLILVPQSIATVSKQRKILYTVFILFWIFPVIFPYFRRAYFLFFGDYYRSFSLFLPFALLFVAIRALSNIEKINIPILLTSVAVLLFILFFDWFDQEKLQELSLLTSPVKSNIRNISALFIIIYGAIMLAFRYFADYKSALLLVLLLVVSVELMYMSNISINDRDVVTTKEFKSKVSYNDYTIEAVEYLKSMDKSFYRTEKDYQSGNAVHGSLNDAQVQGYFGTCRYASFQGKPYGDFIQAFGIAKKGDESSVRWSRGLKGKPLLQITANVKYHLSKSENPEFQNFGYVPIKTFNDVKVLKNSLYLPQGFTYEKYIKRSEFDTLAPIVKEAILLKAVVLEDSTANKTVLQHYDFKDIDFKNLVTDSIAKWRNKLMEDSLQITKWRPDKFEGTISLSKPKILYFSILRDNNWKLQINDKYENIQTCNISFSGILLPKGNYDVKLYYDNSVKGFQKYQSLFIFIFAIVMLGLGLFFKKNILNK